MRRRGVTSPWRGLGARLGATLVGAGLALSLIVGMQVPLLGQPAQAQVHLPRLSAPRARVVWPSAGSAAVLIPSLGVSESVRDATVPIASLTKMMTAYVVLQRLPLAPGQSGPCLSVTGSDVASYQYMQSTDQSSVPVQIGESLCELQLLQGLLVHSADNYAVMLADVVAGDQANFVDLMNQTARAMGLRQTHYADASGYDPASVSSALDQARLAALLMRSALVRSIVRLSQVSLPVGGVEDSYTPYVGTRHVIGVKSGRTSAAGGCDVLAMNLTSGASTRVIYAVVLGQRGGDLLGPAGQAALALARSAGAQVRTWSLGRDRVLGRVGWADSTTPVHAAHSLSLSWWAPRGPLTFTSRLRVERSALHAGQIVGEVLISGPVRARVQLVAGHAATPPSIWQRLR